MVQVLETCTIVHAFGTYTIVQVFSRYIKGDVDTMLL